MSGAVFSVIDRSIHQLGGGGRLPGARVETERGPSLPERVYMQRGAGKASVSARTFAASFGGTAIPTIASGK